MDPILSAFVQAPIALGALAVLYFHSKHLTAAFREELQRERAARRKNHRAIMARLDRIEQQGGVRLHHPEPPEAG